MFSIKSKRSGGVRVTAAVHRILVQGNAARDRRDWAAAAAAFRQAVKAAPELAHIWVQLGNAAKEQGLTDEAEAAYHRAVQLRPTDGEPLLQLGHLFNLQKNHVMSGRYYLKAFQANPRLVDAATAVHRLLARARGRHRDELVEALRAAMADVPGEVDPGAPEAGPSVPGPDATGEPSPLVFDVSDLIGYFAHGRLPTGIQRVQIQVIVHALVGPHAKPGICCFIEGRDEWLEVPADTFRGIVALSLKSGDRSDPEWITALHRLHLRLALSDPLVFRRGATLVNLGSSWQLHNYFLFVRDAKLRYGIRYVPFVHDLIPIVAPEHFTKSARREVIPWVAGIFAHADHFLVNSEATRRDLMQAAAVVGRTLDAGDAAVIRLDADGRASPDGALEQSWPETTLARWQIEAGSFVLLVSTVESRKGHTIALEAWAELISRRGLANVPKLVCAGKRGWLSDAVYQRLEAEPALASRVIMVSAVSDSELSLLYRSCLFTIYPSLYEGWGLPITESLCHGKPVIAANTSSLPEAGGDFAVYVKPGSSLALAAAVERMAYDTGYREALAARIQTGFRPRSWSEVADEIRVKLTGMATRRGASAVATPITRTGSYYPMGRSHALRLRPGVGRGEMFRCGKGWRAPEAAGSWTHPGGGTLQVSLPPRVEPIRVGLLLLGADDCDVEWQVWVKHGVSLRGSLSQRATTWVAFAYPAIADGGVLRIRLQSRPIGRDGDLRGGGAEQTIGLGGLFAHDLGDVKAAGAVLEAMVLEDGEDEDTDVEPGPTPVWQDEWG